MEFKSKNKQQLIVTLIVVLLVVSANLEKAECLSISADLRCNATTMTTDCLVADEEFQMQSESGRRILMGMTPTIGYDKFRPFCDRVTYGSCIGRDSKLYKRPCDYFNTCDRTKAQQ